MLTTPPGDFWRCWRRPPPDEPARRSWEDARVTTSVQRRLIRGLAVAAAVIVSAGLAGAGAGLLLSKANGSDVGDVGVLTNPVATQASGGESSTAGTARGTGGVTISARDARLVPASTDAGRQRRRLSIRVTLSIRNATARPLELARFQLTSGTTTVANDPRATEPANGLLGRLEPDEERVGEIRFETAGSDSGAFTAGRAVTVSAAGQSASVRLVTSSPDP